MAGINPCSLSSSSSSSTFWVIHYSGVRIIRVVGSSDK